MSYTFTLSDKKSILHSDINPPLILDDNAEYVIGLINFDTFNSIPNIDETNNKFHVSELEPIEIPVGCYEVADINKYLRKHLHDPRERVSKSERLYYTYLDIRGNNNTLHTEIKCDKVIDFTPNDSVGKILGFKKRILKANVYETSDSPANIFKVNTLCIECNLVSGSYRNNEESHIIHQMFPNVEPGFKIIEQPNNVIYLPINTRVIDYITIKILDQDGNLVNFREEVVTVRLHLKKL